LGFSFDTFAGGIISNPRDVGFSMGAIQRRNQTWGTDKAGTDKRTFIIIDGSGMKRGT
jgi:hypothetical protein